MFLTSKVFDLILDCVGLASFVFLSLQGRLLDSKGVNTVLCICNFLLKYGMCCLHVGDFGICLGKRGHSFS